MRASFNSYNTSSLLQKVGQKLGVDMDTNCQEVQFTIPKSAGEGVVSYFRFHDGFSNFVFDGNLTQDWEWEFHCEHTSPLYIFFLLSGKLEDVRKDEAQVFAMKPMQTLMVVHPGAASERSIVFKAGERIRVAVLALKKEIYLSNKGCGMEELPTELQLMLSISDKEVRALFPPDRTTLDTSVLVQEILNCPHKGLLRNCFVEAKSRELLVMSLQRSGTEFLDPKDSASLKNIDLERILQAKNYLVSDLKNAPTIEELARHIGLNRQKLKVDFKATFGKTIFQYLREERMRTAKSMLMNSRVTIQAVSSEVGYENTSHFSRRFQEQFGVLPSKFSAMFWRKGQEN